MKSPRVLKKCLLQDAKEILTAVYYNIHEDQNFFGNAVRGTFSTLFKS
jgi:hypothetical protein